MPDANSSRYKYDPLIQSSISSILYVNGELSSNKLRRRIGDFVYDYKELMRIVPRQKDKNQGYVPSPAKISATIDQLLKWKWMVRRNSNNMETNDENKKVLRGLSKVYYSLSQEARFAIDTGLTPDEDFRLEDAFHAVISSAAIGWDYVVLDKELNKIKKINIEGTCTEEILYRHDHLNITIGKYRGRYQRFITAEIQKAIEIALEREIIQKKVIDDDVKYVIVQNLGEFVSFCWRSLFMNTRNLVEIILELKKIPKKSEDYHIIFSWMSKFHDESEVNAIIQRCNITRTKISKTDRQELLLIAKRRMKRSSLLKLEASSIYDKNIKAKDKANFHNLKDAVIRYVCPENILDIARRILPSELRTV